MPEVIDHYYSLVSPWTYLGGPRLDAIARRAVAGENGLDGAALLAAADTGAVREEYAANTAEAIARGVFGAPSYVHRGELFWGQDRLDFLERALARDPG